MEIDTLLLAALREDLGEEGDLTSQATIAPDATARARIVAREEGCVAGVGATLRVFALLDGEIRIAALASDGDVVAPGTALAEIIGSARSILAAERVALNLLGHLSGVATATRALVDRVSGTRARILDTRKTIPNLRILQKAAVRAGGGSNHRMGLFDAVLIKDNHIAAVGSVREAVLRARRHVGDGVQIEVEVERVDDVEVAIAAGADVVLLDNMDLEAMSAAVRVAAGRCLLEASGGITEDTVRAVAETGVDRISVGALTHSVRSLDVALDFID